MSEEINKNPSTPENSFTPKWTGYPFLEVKFHGNNLRQDSVPFLHKKCSKLIYFLQTRYMVKRFKDRFHIWHLPIWGCEVN